MYLRKISTRLLLAIAYVSFSFLFAQQNYQDWLKQQQSALESFSNEQNSYNTATTIEFQNYLNQQEQLFQNYKNEIEQRPNIT